MLNNLINKTLKDFLFFHHDREISKLKSHLIVNNSKYGDCDLILKYDSVSRSAVDNDLLGLRSALSHYADCSTTKVRFTATEIVISLYDMSNRKSHLSSLMY